MDKLIKSAARRGAAWVIAIIILAVLGAAGGGLYYAAQTGLIEVPYLSPKPPDTKEIISYFKSMKSAELAITYDLQAEPVSEGAAAEDGDEEGDGGEGGSMADALGLGLDLDSLVSGQSSFKGQATAKIQPEQARLEANLKGQLGMSDMTINVDLATMLIDEVFYLQVNALPIPFIDLKPLSQTWVRVSGPIDANEAVYGTYKMFEEDGEETDDSGTETEDNDASIIETFWERGLDSGVLQMTTSDRRSQYAGEAAWEMLVTYDTDRLISLIKSIYEDPPEGLSEKDIEQFADLYKEDIQSGELKKKLDTLKKEMTVKLTVLRQSRRPVKLFVLVDHQPDPDAKADDLSAKVMMTVTADKVNQDLSISSPSDALNIDEAISIIMGMDESSIKVGQQFSAISALRRALLAYHQANGSYPDQLSGLVGLEMTGTPSGVIARIPSDPFTKKPYPYSTTADGYELKYVLRANTDGDLPDKAWVYLEATIGDNTATELSGSKEGSSAADWDGDGLSNYREHQLKTSALLADTDGDGFSDKAELDGGYDPLTNAQTGQTVSQDDLPTPNDDIDGDGLGDYYYWVNQAKGI